LHNAGKGYSNSGTGLADPLFHSAFLAWIPITASGGLAFFAAEKERGNSLIESPPSALFFFPMPARPAAMARRRLEKPLRLLRQSESFPYECF
jgi:hypothetical protein